MRQGTVASTLLFYTGYLGRCVHPQFLCKHQGISTAVSQEDKLHREFWKHQTRKRGRAFLSRSTCWKVKPALLCCQCANHGVTPQISPPGLLLPELGQYFCQEPESWWIPWGLAQVNSSDQIWPGLKYARRRCTSATEAEGSRWFRLFFPDCNSRNRSPGPAEGEKEQN